MNIPYYFGFGAIIFGMILVGLNVNYMINETIHIPAVFSLICGLVVIGLGGWLVKRGIEEQKEKIKVE